MANDYTARSVEFQDPLIGRVLQDRYRVLRLLGRGGMGVVYLAEHVVIQRKLAVKVLHSQWTASEELVKRFHREARAAAAAGDEHVVDVTDMGRLEDGTYYMVLEYLDGPDLAALVERDGPLAVERVVAIGVQICEALRAVHAAGIVHRDLKPENVVLIRRRQREDFVKILDFGICKVFNELPLTATGVALGTPQFMAPEQLEARPEVDQRADIYALGAILFFALTGRNLFESESLPRLLVSIWSEPPPKLRAVRPDAPQELERLIARTLEKHPARRFEDVDQLSADLSAIGTALGLRRVEHEWALTSGVREAAAPVAVAPYAGNESGIRRRPRSLVAVCGAVLSAVMVGWLYLLATSIATPVHRPRSAAPVSAPPAAARAESRAEFDPPAEAPEEHEPRPQSSSPVRKARPRVRANEPMPAPSDPPPTAAPSAASAPNPQPNPQPQPRAAPAESMLVPRPANVKSVFE